MLAARVSHTAGNRPPYLQPVVRWRPQFAEGAIFCPTPQHDHYLYLDITLDEASNLTAVRETQT